MQGAILEWFTDTATTSQGRHCAGTKVARTAEKSAGENGSREGRRFQRRSEDARRMIVTAGRPERPRIRALCPSGVVEGSRMDEMRKRKSLSFVRC